MIIHITIYHHNLTLVVNVVNVEVNTAFSSKGVNADLEIFQKTSNLVEPFLHMTHSGLQTYSVNLKSVLDRFIETTP